jgi:hypothetical protein
VYALEPAVPLVNTTVTLFVGGMIRGDKVPLMYVYDTVILRYDVVLLRKTQKPFDSFV